MCDIGRCSSVRRHGVSQNSTTLFDTPTWSATMLAGNTHSVMLKCTSAHRRLERTSMWSLTVELRVTDASGAIDVRGTRSYHERGQFWSTAWRRGGKDRREAIAPARSVRAHVS